MSTLFRRLLGALLALSLLMFSAPAFAMDRAQFYFGESPQSADLNFVEQAALIALGEWMWDSTGRNTTGFYIGLSVTSPTGLYLQVGPTTTNTNGVVFSPGPADISPVGAGGPFTSLSGYAPLPASATQILHAGMTQTNIGPLGPLVAPTGGNSVIDLAECAYVSADSIANNVSFVSPANLKSQAAVPQRRTDGLACQAKLGTPATTPVAPTVDANYVGIATVTLASGVNSISGGSILPLSPWGGFLAAGSGQSFVDTVTNNQNINASKIFNSPIIMNGAAERFAGSGLVTLSGPSLAGDGQSNPGLLVNTSSGSAGVQFLTNGATNGASVTTSGAFVSGSSVYGSGSESVAGAVSTGTATTAASGNNYTVNSNATTTGGYVAAQYNAGATNNTGGFRVYDGGTTNFSTLTPTALTFPGSSYGSASATVGGPIASTSLVVGHCVSVNSSYQLIDAGGPCGLTSGTITSIASANALVGASNTGGVVTLTPNETPTFTGTITDGLSATTGQLNLGTDATVALSRSGSNLVATAPGTVSSATGFSAGSSLYYPTQTYTNGNHTASGSIAAGSATGATLSAGDLGASRSVSTGAVVVGGSTDSAKLDYGVTTAGALTANKPLIDTLGVFGNSLTATTTVTSNSVQTNALYLNGPIYQSGSTVNPWSLPMYGVSGSLYTSGTPHEVFGSVTLVNGSTVTVTFTGSAVFSSASSYACYGMNNSGAVTTAPPSIQALSASSIQIYEAAGFNYLSNFICRGY